MALDEIRRILKSTDEILGRDRGDLAGVLDAIEKALDAGDVASARRLVATAKNYAQPTADVPDATRATAPALEQRAEPEPPKDVVGAAAAVGAQTPTTETNYSGATPPEGDPLRPTTDGVGSVLVAKATGARSVVPVRGLRD